MSKYDELAEKICIESLGITSDEDMRDVAALLERELAPLVEAAQLSRVWFEANARLIAAAPDMYEALKQAKLQIEYLSEKFAPTGTGNATLAKIDAAIANVEGK